MCVCCCGGDNILYTIYLSVGVVLLADIAMAVVENAERLAVKSVVISVDSDT